MRRLPMLALASALSVAFVSVAVPAPVEAQSPRQMRQQVETSMLVSGSVDIEPDGSVSAHALDGREKLPADVVALIERAVGAMRFEPVMVEGEVVKARAAMRLRVVASPIPEDPEHMSMRIASAHFGDDSEDAGARYPSAKDLPPPRYPQNVARIGGAGTVYLLVKVGRDGTPEDVVAEQVNLTSLGTARQMERVRRELAAAAVAQARDHWTFTPPTEGDGAGASSWVMRIPVDFSLDTADETAYGQWRAYHPGERTRPEWANSTSDGFSPDLLLAGEVAPESSAYKLLSPVGG